MEIEKRNQWVDYAKGVGIILVVYGHVARGIFNARIPVSEAIYKTADGIIYSFHMPLFFFLAGLFFYTSFAKRSFFGFLASKVDTVIYPYIVWSILQGSIEVLLGRFTNGHVSFEDVFSLIWAPRAQFWFLYSLFQVFLIASAVYIKNGRWYFLGVAVVASLCYLYQYEFFGIAWLKMAIPFFCFFSVGVLYQSVLHLAKENKVKIFLFLCPLAISGQWYTHAGLPINNSEEALILFIVSLASIILVCTFCQIIEVLDIPLLALLGQLSMPIYLAHVIAAAAVRILMQKFVGVTDFSIHLILGMVVGLTIPVMLYKAANRFGLHAIFVVPSLFSVQRLIGR